MRENKPNSFCLNDDLFVIWYDEEILSPTEQENYNAICAMQRLEDTN